MQALSATEYLPGIERERVIPELDDIDGLVTQYRARLLRFVLLSVADEDLAASIVQDTFLRAWTARSSFRGDCTVKSWLTSIALNLIRDHYRIRKLQFWRRMRSQSIDIFEAAGFLLAAGSSPEAQLLAREQARQITAALQDLSPNQRTVFLLRFQEEMEVSEIAAVMKMPVNTVKTHLHRAVRVIRGRFGGIHA